MGCEVRLSGCYIFNAQKLEYFLIKITPVQVTEPHTVNFSKYTTHTVACWGEPELFNCISTVV